MPCKHRSTSEKFWLPRTTNKLLAPHPCCRECGFVKNISGEKAKGIGYYINVLSMLKRKEKLLTEAQTRLIVKELQRVGLR